MNDLTTSRRPWRTRALSILVGCSAVLLAPLVLGCQLLSEQQRRDPAVLAEGRRLLAANCYQCHYLHEPADFTDAAWTPIVRDMGRRAQLTPLQTEKLLAWMQWANDRPAAQRGPHTGSGPAPVDGINAATDRLP